MGISQINVISVSLFFVSIFVSGLWLRKSGKPYSSFKLTVHKFITLGVLVYLARAVYLLHQQVGLVGVDLFASSTSLVLGIVTVITGGLVSIEKEMPGWVRVLHKLAPYLTMLSIAGSLSLLLD